MRNMRHSIAGVIAGLLLVPSQTVFAQSAAVEWSNVAKITNGNCGDGAIAQVVERPDGMNIKTFVNGKQTGDFNMTLAADGSGKIERTTGNGRTIFEVSAGKGRRAFKSSQLEGPCRWTWTPK